MFASSTAPLLLLAAAIAQPPTASPSERIADLLSDGVPKLQTYRNDSSSHFLEVRQADRKIDPTKFPDARDPGAHYKLTSSKVDWEIDLPYTMRLGRVCDDGRVAGIGYETTLSGAPSSPELKGDSLLFIFSIGPGGRLDWEEHVRRRSGASFGGCASPWIADTTVHEGSRTFHVYAQQSALGFDGVLWVYRLETGERTAETRLVWPRVADELVTSMHAQPIAGEPLDLVWGVISRPSNSAAAPDVQHLKPESDQGSRHGPALMLIEDDGTIAWSGTFPDRYGAAKRSSWYEATAAELRPTVKGRTITVPLPDRPPMILEIRPPSGELKAWTVEEK